MSNVHNIAKPLVNHAREELGDAALWGKSGQAHRWGHKPLQTLFPQYTNFGSFKGRGYCVKEFLHTIVREPYRAGKNVLLVLEKIVNFVREFFQTLFREPTYTWSGVGQNAKDIVNASLALPARALTYFLDLAKLAVGVLVPKAAIHKIIQIDDNGGVEVEIH